MRIQAAETFATVPGPGGIIAGTYFLFEPLRWTGGDNIVPRYKRKGMHEYFCY